MLERAGAKVAAGYYERALLACLDDEPAYQAFLSGDFISENALKVKLQLLSVEYFRSGHPFDREAADWLIEVGAARGLLVGSRGAHSGSSTTYVHLGAIRQEWQIPATEFLEFRLDAAPSHFVPAGAIQAALERQGRAAGLVGARFTPEPEWREIMVCVAVGRSHTDRNSVGISHVEGQAVLDGISAQTRGAPFRELGPGRLDVLWAVSHDVDSSPSGFNKLAGQLLPLLFLPLDADENQVRLAWRRQTESVSIANMSSHLKTGLTGHPERGVFQPGATEAALRGLEGSLGQAIPEAVREWLLQFNGGSFVDDRAQEEEAETELACTYCELLSAQEMESELFDLIAINDASTQVDRWEGRRPIHAQIRRADGSLAPWPYLPIVRTIEGREILVVELNDAGRVLDAFHELGPDQWRMVYPRYVDFIGAFLSEGGCVRASGK